jgi:hypothetical protein
MKNKKEPNWKTEIKNYILMGFNAEGVKKEDALKQVEIIWDCIEPIIEELLRQERDRQRFIEILEGIKQRIIEDYKAMLKLYGGKLPFVVFPGKADEEEKVAIYWQAINDFNQTIQEVINQLKDEK